MARKKVVLFIVEGISDVAALEGSLRNVYKPNEIKFCIVRSDITSDDKTSRSNILRKVGTLIKDELARNPYEKSDILKVIHFVDMDGAYVREDAIVEDSSYEKFYYSVTTITGRSKDSILDRNIRKSENLDSLSKLTNIYGGLDYSLYYFSCDQEHVLHNKMNVLDSEKMRLADDFNDKYEDDFDGFKELMSSEDIKVEGSYKETWEFIKRDNNSLKRYSNLHILLEEENI